MICKMEDCISSQLDGRPFFCKKHWDKVPRKIKSELNNAYENNKGTITIVHLDQLILKGKWSIKIPGSWEKRAEFSLAKLLNQAKKEKILIVTGSKSKEPGSKFMWDGLKFIIKNLNITEDTKIVKDFKSAPNNKIAVVLGEAGYKQTLPEYKVKNGFIHGGNVILTPKQYLEEMWKFRPVNGSYANNKYIISCEPNPNEYDDFGEDEIDEIVKCLKWVKNMYQARIDGFKKIE